MDSFQRLNWTNTQVADFWNFIEKSEARKEEYFTKFYSDSIINFLKNLVIFNGEILDYGCGLGFLTEKLLENKISCQACDFSESSVKLVNQKFQHNPLWKGAKLIQSSELPYADNSIDLIICIETIEHILDPLLLKTLQEFHRILKPKTGKLFITTPNNEDLEKGLIFCPQCHVLFHYYQHLHSFNIDTLSTLMQDCGFNTELCQSTNFDLFKPNKVPHILDWSLRRWKEILKQIIINTSKCSRSFHRIIEKYFFGRNFKNDLPHLFWFGAKD